MPTERVPAGAEIEITAHAYDRAQDRLRLDPAAVREQAPRAKRIDQYKDGLRLWRIEGGWLAVHEISLPGAAVFRAVVVTALDDSMLDGWKPRARRPRSGPRLAA